MTNKEFYEKEKYKIVNHKRKNLCRDFVMPIILKTDEPCISWNADGTLSVRSYTECHEYQMAWGAEEYEEDN